MAVAILAQAKSFCYLSVVDMALPAKTLDVAGGKAMLLRLSMEATTTTTA